MAFLLPKMDPEQEQTQEATHRLEEIQVDSIGLVARGANNSTFLLLKSQQQEAPMQDDELEIEEVVETPSFEEETPPTETSPPDVVPVDDGFFEKMRGQFEKWGLVKAHASKDAIAAAAKMLGVSPKQMQSAYAGMMGEDDEEEMEMGKRPASQPKPGKQTTRKDALRQAQDVPLVPEAIVTPPKSEETNMTKDDLQKAITDGVAMVKADLEKSYQEKVSTLETQVADLSKEATDQRDKREEREFLEKAMTFRCFPVEYTELGKMLRQLNKSMDKDAYEKWESVLKAADAQLFTAGLFSEMGTARTADEVVLEERVEKIAKEKNVSYKEALLTLSPAEQTQMLRETQARAGGKHAS